MRPPFGGGGLFAFYSEWAMASCHAHGASRVEMDRYA
jgi:hypothetical protein